MVTKSTNTNKPYLLDILPHYYHPFESATEAIRYFADNWSYPTTVHIVADAAFGSFEFGTLSMAETKCNWLWPLLNSHTEHGSWKACQKRSCLAC